VTATRKSLLASVDAYYSARIASHGPGPNGVDWNSAESQELRFEQLLRICSPGDGFSLNDYGCGYGALYGYLQSRGMNIDYRGFDVSEQMIRHATAQYGDRPHTQFDYTLASGIFNVRMDATEDVWREYMLASLDRMDAMSRRGFSFNCLTVYSDADRMRDYLYYADPCLLFDHCKRRYSLNVALLHDYGLYEFTLLVRKQL
jgi:SAM-dependent methyltransferase